jgi:hypothetical protein
LILYVGHQIEKKIQSILVQERLAQLMLEKASLPITGTKPAKFNSVLSTDPIQQIFVHAWHDFHVCIYVCSQIFFVHGHLLTFCMLSRYAGW